MEFTIPKGGFSFENYTRNLLIEKQGIHFKTATKTGTTIAGVIFKNGVVLGADTRATNDTIVCDKNCEKIHYIAPNIFCCGAGTAADTENSTSLISSKLELHRLSTGRKSRVVTAQTLLANMLFKYQGHISAALVLGGYDVDGPHLYSIHPHGSVDSLPYVTMGSGSLAAMAVFEDSYKEGMEEQEAIDLVEQAITAGIINDLGSGSNVDICVITKEMFEKGLPVKMLRNYKKLMPRKYIKPGGYDFKRGTTAILSQSFDPVEINDGDLMDL
eukprot:TRINITY_DN2650_c1_g1_i1.p1 TRINITY_DN2650_c1_g1~~TRINITY_DN2650_c1_g1_i1.p1  ORF type:complete len:272 (-),score=74.27 TRINITY_DN2650_c1_g1_i1:70-885(-)